MPLLLLFSPGLMPSNQTPVVRTAGLQLHDLHMSSIRKCSHHRPLTGYDAVSREHAYRNAGCLEKSASSGKTVGWGTLIDRSKRQTVGIERLDVLTGLRIGNFCFNVGADLTVDFRRWSFTLRSDDGRVVPHG
ncbi:hypothetical protein CC78DRAFT_576680 [Lojkania enalia]|uniref:Uncharacterized protein n=1 Tax=Lojkania enalia TaxID=147567 RepID=A0A9P4KJ16_9PLEO|nr:hypothetical protein CC78DRAFT_576680 [Didymosphaeria enalia]